MERFWTLKYLAQEGITELEATLIKDLPNGALARADTLPLVFGLTGTQGVIIPESNVRNLVLREDVLAAIEAGTFSVWPIATVEEGIELLMGEPAGEDLGDPEDTGFRYPERSVYGRIERRLARLRRLARESRRDCAGRRIFPAATSHQTRASSTW